MVVFDEDPVELITTTHSAFRIDSDRDSLTRISTHLRDLATTRAARADAQRATLASLGRKLNSLEGRRDYERERHDPGRHATEMVRMDAEKFRIAKGASEAEVEAGRLEGELVGLRAELEGLEREGVEGGRRKEGGPGGKDEVVLKLQFYRSLGIEATRDEASGEYTRAVIRNSERGDVSVVSLDGALKRADYADAFWDAL